MPNCDQMWTFLTNLNTSIQYKISLQSVQFEPSQCMQSDKQMDSQTDLIKLIGTFMRMLMQLKTVKSINGVLSVLYSI